MAPVGVLSLVVVVAVAAAAPCGAYDFYVGGRDGWVERPREAYNSWAGRNRFQVQDRLVFKYEKGNDSVLVVDAAAYGACNVTEPEESYTDGDSVFRFNRSGPFYFISGANGHCAAGQRMIVVVLAVRNRTAPSTPPAAAPAPSQASPVSPEPLAPEENPTPPPPPPPPPPMTVSSPAANRAVPKVQLLAALIMALGGALHF